MGCVSAMGAEVSRWLPGFYRWRRWFDAWYVGFQHLPPAFRGEWEPLSRHARP